MSLTPSPVCCSPVIEFSGTEKIFSGDQSYPQVVSTRGSGRITILGKCGVSGRVGSRSGQPRNFQKPIPLSHGILITPIINFYPGAPSGLIDYAQSVVKILGRDKHFV